MTLGIIQIYINKTEADVIDGNTRKSLHLHVSYKYKASEITLKRSDNINDTR